MTDTCNECAQILNGTKTTSVKCFLKRNRKYIIGAFVGAVVVFCLMKMTGGKHGGK